MYGVLCVRLNELYRSPKDDVLTQSTADTYHKELETLTAILANRVKQLLPDENTKKMLHHRKKKLDKLSKTLNLHKYTNTKTSSRETFANRPSTNPPEKAFADIKRIARTPKQLNVHQNADSVGRDAPDGDSISSRSTDTTAIYQHIHHLPKPVQTYLNASRNWYNMYNHSVSVATNSLLDNRNKILKAKHTHKKQLAEVHKKNKQHYAQSKEHSAHMLRKYNVKSKNANPT
jgi:hypothetical protein